MNRANFALTYILLLHARARFIIKIIIIGSTNIIASLLFAAVGQLKHTGSISQMQGLVISFHFWIKKISTGKKLLSLFLTE